MGKVEQSRNACTWQKWKLLYIITRKKQWNVSISSLQISFLGLVEVNYVPDTVEILTRQQWVMYITIKQMNILLTSTLLLKYWTMSVSISKYHWQVYVSCIPVDSTPRFRWKIEKLHDDQTNLMTYVFPHVDANDRLVCYSAQSRSESVV